MMQSCKAALVFSLTNGPFPVQWLCPLSLYSPVCVCSPGGQLLVYLSTSLLFCCNQWMFSAECFSHHCHHNVTDLHIHDLAAAAAAAGTADPEPLLTWTFLVFYCPLAVVLGIVARPIYQQVQTLDGANSPFITYVLC